MNALSRKIVAVSILPAVPLTIILIRDFVYFRRGWNIPEIQYQAIFWIVRLVLSPWVIFYTIKCWKELNRPVSLVITQLSGFVVYSSAFWGLSFALCSILMNTPDHRYFNLFNTIRSDSFTLNVLLYVVGVSIFYAWTYFERNSETGKRVFILQRALTQKEEALRSFHDGVVESSFPQSKLSKEKLDKLSIKNGSRTAVVNVRDVTHFTADGPYVRVITEGRTHLLSRPLHDLQNVLPHFFLRIHRSCIVNTEFIKEIKSLLNGDYTVVLKNGTEIRASRTYRENLRAALGRL